MAVRKQSKKVTSRRVKRNNKKNSSKTSRKGRVKYLVILLLFVATFFYLATNTRFWATGNKLILVTTQNSDVNVVIYDTEIEKITTVAVPGDTFVNVPRGLGSMRIKNVWQLGENEGMDGLLLAETITKNLRIPVVVWAAGDVNAFSEGNYIQIVGAMFRPYKTNMNIADRIHLGLFALSVKDFKKEGIDITNTSYLKEEKLPDGNTGYMITGKVPKSIAILASDNAFAKEGVRVAIYDGTDVSGYAEEIGMIIEAMGGKVISVNKTDFNGDCLVVSRNDAVKERIDMLFSCTGDNGDPKGNYDLELTIGKGFYMRF